MNGDDNKPTRQAVFEELIEDVGRTVDIARAVRTVAEEIDFALFGKGQSPDQPEPCNIRVKSSVATELVRSTGEIRSALEDALKILQGISGELPKGVATSCTSAVPQWHE
jgi:hypothetical protein